MNFPRATLLLIALLVTYVGYEECRLRLHCPAPRSLDLRDLESLQDEGPLWAHVEGDLAPLSPVILATGADESRGVWLAVSRPDEPGAIAAILELSSLEEAKSLQAAGGPVEVQGIARLASAADGERLKATAHSSGMRLARGLRIVEVGRRPGKLFLSLVVLAGGVITAVLAVCGLERLREASAPEGVYVPPAYRSPPLTEEVRRKLEHMVSTVWDEAS